MKIQFASIESAVSLLLVLSFVTFYAEQTNELVSSAYNGLINLRDSAAIYDIAQQINSNSIVRNCILQNNPSCTMFYLNQYTKILDLKTVSLQVNGSTIGNSTGTLKSACFPFVQNKINQTICVSLG